MNERIQERLRQLQEERQRLVDQAQQLATELERTRHLISAYDGALGELSALLQPEEIPDES